MANSILAPQFFLLFVKSNSDKLWGLGCATPPSVAKWNILGSNDSDANARLTGTGTISSLTLTNPYKFSAYMSSAGSTAISTWTRTPVNIENYDTGNNLDTTTNVGRFIAPVSGIYRFDGHLHTTIYGTTGRLIVALYKNGAEFAFGSDSTVGSGAYVGANVGEEISLAANNYVEFMYFSSISQGIDVAANRTRFSGFLVSAT